MNGDADMKKENMKTVLFGYDRKTVNNFLKKLHRLQEEELAELRRKVGKAGDGRDCLLAELTQLEEKRNEELPEDQMESARNRVNETLQESELFSAANIIEEKANGNASRKAIDFSDAAARRARKVVSLKEMTEVVSIPAIATEGEVVEVVSEKAADEGSQSEAAAAAAMDETIAIEPEPIGEYQSAPEVSARPVQAEGLGFWDDAEAFLERVSDELLLPMYEITAAAEASSDAAALSMPAPPSEPMQKQPPVSRAVAFAASESTAAPERTSSPELDALKRSYIVGKLAGEDLLDRRGHVLVARNIVITEEAIRLAEREGKLAELIVNMIIPGLED
jgi:hypothetical protein